jgi:hypothetical protein
MANRSTGLYRYERYQELSLDCEFHFSKKVNRQSAVVRSLLLGPEVGHRFETHPLRSALLVFVLERRLS